MNVLYNVKKFAPFIVLVAIIVVIFIMTNLEEDDDEDVNLIDLEQMNEINDEIEIEVHQFVVDIKGEVNQPGVYSIASEGDPRVNDLIVLAGGFTKDAEVNVINLAQKVHDEMVIYVPKIGEENIEMLTSYESAEASGKVAINRATAEEITTLHGIGPAKAEAIISYREEHGPFNSVDDLLQVSGIGEKTLEKIRDEIIIP